MAALALSLPPVLGAALAEPRVGPLAGGLVISEVMTGGVSASDEFIEIHNPTTEEIGLDGLELVYVSATGTTISRRASWDAGAPSVRAGGHLLVAHAAGIHGAIADATYESGIAAAGGSVALRQQGASGAIDAVGWGTASSAWLEGSCAPAPGAGESIERLPGGSLGSGQDTGDNMADFAIRALPDPQSSRTLPIPQPTSVSSPSSMPSTTPPPPTAAPTALPSVSVAAARGLADGSLATITATALTGAAFSEGGGYVADASGGIAVLVENGTFERGQLLVVTGEVDDRFHQRTLRVDGQPLVVGSGVEPSPIETATGAVGEPLEGRLVAVDGRIAGAPTALSGGLAFAVDDGSGEARVVVGSDTGIVTDAWETGATVSIVGVVGQRDSSGGTGGYRVQPRDVRDVAAVTPPPTFTPSPSPSAAPSSNASPLPPSAAGRTLSIAEARDRASGESVRVRGVVTLPDDLVEEGSAVVQDASAAIELRLGEGAGGLSRGELIEVVGTRSTNAGMLTIRVTELPTRLGRSPEPPAATLPSGAASDEHEARLVIVRGALVASARRAASGTVSFEIDDGSGALRVVVATATGAESLTQDLEAGTWVEVRGVLGQQTTGAQPTAGYRLWPRDADDLTVVATAAGRGALDAGDTAGADDETATGRAQGKSSAQNETEDSLAAVLDAANGGPRRLEATLVAGAWPQFDVAGVLWDGRQAAAIVDDAHARAALGALLADGAPPVVVRLSVAGPAGAHAESGVPLLRLARDERVERAPTKPSSPATDPPETGPPQWVRLTGRFSRDGSDGLLARPAGTLRVELACDALRSMLPSSGETIALLGLATAEPPRVFVGCDGLRRGPTLALTSDEGASAALAPPPTTPISPADEPRPDHGVVAIVVLAALAAILTVGAVILRRALHRAVAEPDPAAALASDESDQATADGDPPQLTLVHLPRDRGSP